MKDSQKTKLEERLRILVKPNLRELCNSKFAGLRTFDNTAVSLSYIMQ